MSIAEKITGLRAALPQHVELIAVSKTYPPSAVLEAYRAGQRAFGENRPQELVEKYHALPKDIRWHQIGGLQSNKVKNIAPFVATSCSKYASHGKRRNTDGARKTWSTTCKRAPTGT